MEIQNYITVFTGENKLKMIKINTLLIAVPLILCSQLVDAANTNLFDWGFNIDSAVSIGYDGDPVPNSINSADFDFNTGLGTLSISINDTGAHSFHAFFDHEIDEGTNGFYNEIGSTLGNVVTGQSWEIDEPGFISGDIFDNFNSGSLDNSIGVTVVDDVSMSLGWDFALEIGEIATISLLLSETDIDSGFRLQHNDPDSQASVFFSSTLNIEDNQQTIPEPSGIWLIGSGLISIVSRFSLRRQRKH